MKPQTVNDSPFMSARVLRPDERRAVTCSSLKFLKRPRTYCRLTTYYEPVESVIKFSIVGDLFSITGLASFKMDHHFLVTVSAVEGNAVEISGDVADAVRLGFFQLMQVCGGYCNKPLRSGIICPRHQFDLIRAAIPGLSIEQRQLRQADLDFTNIQSPWELVKESVTLSRNFNLELFIATYIDGMHRSLGILETHECFREQLLLMMCAIDHMAWLARPTNQEHVNCSDFGKWVYQHLRLAGTVEGAPELTTGDLYQWRCVWVHTYGGQESKLAPSNAFSEDYKTTPEVTVLGLKNLRRQLGQAIKVFLVHCSLDPNLLMRVNERLLEMPQIVPVDDDSPDGLATMKLTPIKEANRSPAQDGLYCWK